MAYPSSNGDERGFHAAPILYRRRGGRRKCAAAFPQRQRNHSSLKSNTKIFFSPEMTSAVSPEFSGCVYFRGINDWGIFQRGSIFGTGFPVSESMTNEDSSIRTITTLCSP